MKIDILNLTNQEDGPKCSRLYCTGPNLRDFVKKCFNILSKEYKTKKKLSQELQKYLGGTYSGTECIVFKIFSKKMEWVPLKVLSFLKTRGFKNCDKYVNFIKGGGPVSKPIKAVKRINIQLCKIVGAHVADGYLSKRYELEIIDHDKLAISKFAEWLYNVFGLKVMVFKHKREDAWKIQFKNMAFARYLTNIFGLPKGKKYHLIKEPNIIRNSKYCYKKAFFKAYLTFEGYVTEEGNITCSSKSKEIIKNLSEMFEKDKIKNRIFYDKRKKIYIIYTKKINRITSYHYLEKDTIKSKKALATNINLFSKNLTKISKLAEELQIFDYSTIYKKSKISNTRLGRYLYLLAYMGEIKKIRRLKWNQKIKLENFNPINVSVLIKKDIIPEISKTTNKSSWYFKNQGITLKNAIKIFQKLNIPLENNVKEIRGIRGVNIYLDNSFTSPPDSTSEKTSV